MSRSRRIAAAPPPEVKGRRLLERPGVRLVGAAAVYFAATVGLRLGLGAALRALFSAWNVNADTVARAPGWARGLYVWQGSVVTLLVSAAAIGLTVGLFRVRVGKPCFVGRAWLVGTGVAAVSAALFLLTDSLRLEWPLNRPHFTAGLLPLCLLSLLTAVAEELFTKGVLYDGAKPPWGALWATLAFFLINGGYAGTVISGINVALMGLLCTLIYARWGLWADAAFRWGWSFATVFLLGQGGGERAVYRLYGVSEALLTGGDGGFVYGLWLTGVLVGMILWMVRAFRKMIP